MGSSGTLFFSTYDLTELAADNFLSNGTITFDGATDAAAFDTTEADGGVYVTLVPEPSSSFFAVAGLGMLLLKRRRN